MLPGLEDRVGHPLLERRRGHHRHRRTRHLLLSERPGAEVPPAPDPHGRDRRRRHRHPAEHRQATEGYSCCARRPDRKLPAAHAPARQGDDDGSDPADRPDRGAQPRRRLQLQLAQRLRLRRPAAPLLPKGTIIKVTAWHDNTAANKANPDPNVWVGYGDRTVDEMAHAWVNVTYMNDERLRRAGEARDRPRSRATTAARQQLTRR